MPTVTGKDTVRAYFAELPKQLTKVLRGAGLAAGKVIAEEAKVRSPSADVAGDIVVRRKVDDGRIVVTITVKPGYNWYRALWLEFGTEGHFISVDDSQRGGRGIGRINQQVRAAGGDKSLVIGGQFVGATVWHKGARPEPFLRPALDFKEAEAIRAAQAYINSRIARGRFVGKDEGDDA
ncbi:HK97 gp10 family phage protein [Sphingobium yanoikuyae]|uniref:HK97 gp10 family phage protein n=1 Tax=Sphingobium yanoikuyae TaxID=13690 RepID=UPI0028DB28D0|nr:HK97 gp10 family phage protein [Sphingobium yanoikuyae]